MTNDLDHDLRDTFRQHEHDLLGHSPTPTPDMVRRIRRRQTGTVLMAIAAVAAIAIAGLSGLDAIRSSEQTPAVPGRAETGPAVTGPAETGPAETGPTALEPAVPPPGIPPPGATRSLPETGELILSVDLGSDAPTRTREALTHMYVYADGRLIWSRGAALPEGTNGYNTGLVEQRLTPEGVELMRSEVVSSGLIDPDSVMVDGEADPDPFPFLGFIIVRDADRLVGREFAYAGYATGGAHHAGETTCRPAWGCAHIATAEEESALKRLNLRLTDPASWLPASAWGDQEIRAYVPSRYKVCYGGETETVEPERVLNAVPGPAEELLRAKAKQPTRVGSSYGGGHRYTIYCSELTTEEARDVVRGLDDGGFERQYAHATFEYIFSVPGPAGTAALWIDPYLPHGDAICIPCNFPFTDF